MKHKHLFRLVTTFIMISFLFIGYAEEIVSGTPQEAIIHIDWVDIGVDYKDVPPGRNYELYTWGNSIEECIENASISEIDQDGGELDTYIFYDATNNVKAAVMKIITEAAIEAGILESSL